MNISNPNFSSLLFVTFSSAPLLFIEIPHEIDKGIALYKTPTKLEMGNASFISDLNIDGDFILVFQSCDLPQQSIVHIVQNPQKKDEEVETESKNVSGILTSSGGEAESLTRVDLNTNLLPSHSAGLAVILDTVDDGISPLSGNSGKLQNPHNPKYRGFLLKLIVQ